MKERPIIFSGDMVRAILDGRKTQTRRIVKPARERSGSGCELAPCEIAGEINSGDYTLCPYGKPGDRLWVRETWRPHAPEMCGIDNSSINYRADDYHWLLQTKEEADLWLEARRPEEQWPQMLVPKWRPSIHMPRWASRLALEVTGVRVERVQDISDSDATAEGLQIFNEDGNLYYSGLESDPETWFTNLAAWHCDDPIAAYRDLWERINGPGSWERNDWVWVVEFKVINPAPGI